MKMCDFEKWSSCKSGLFIEVVSIGGSTVFMNSWVVGLQVICRILEIIVLLIWLNWKIIRISMKAMEIICQPILMRFSIQNHTLHKGQYRCNERQNQRTVWEKKYPMFVDCPLSFITSCLRRRRRWTRRWRTRLWSGCSTRRSTWGGSSVGRTSPTTRTRTSRRSSQPAAPVSDLISLLP